MYEEIQVHTGPVQSTERPTQGGYFDVTILNAQRGRFILKTARQAELIRELAEESRVLAGLQDQAPFVAQPLARVDADGASQFLFSCVDGVTMLDVLATASAAEKYELVAEFGRALRRIHGWQPAFPRPADWIAEAIAKAAATVAAGEVPNPIRHSGVFGGQEPQAVLAELQVWQHSVTTDLVFGHGDYCVPNALFRGGRISGIVDWSRGGYRDRRYDLASGAWSVGYNFGSREYVQTFLDAYGYTEPAESLQEFEALYVLLP